MTLYLRKPRIKLRKERWGGIASTKSGEVILLKGEELFRTIFEFSSIKLEDDDLTNEVRELIELGLILKDTST